MTQALRKDWFARLLAATLSLALIAASLAGTPAHARDHVHHHGTAAVHAGHVADAVDAILAAPGAKATDHQSKHKHCTDFFCHGGVAILGPGSPWSSARWPEARISSRQPDALAPVIPDRLDRPPKAFRSA